MLKKIALASAIAFGIAAPAHASDIQRANTASQPTHTALPAEVVEVTSTRPNPVGTILGDGLGGAVIGTAVGGSVALYNRYGPNNDGTFGNWQRDLAIGAGIGLGVGLLVGVVSVASDTGSRADRVSVADQKSIGFAAPAGQYGMRF